MGNCGTREENAVVAAHAQGIHPFRFAPGFSWADSCRWLLGLDLRLGTSNCIGISSLLDYFPAPSWLLVLLVGGLTVTVDVDYQKCFLSWLSIAMPFGLSVVSDWRFGCKIRFFSGSNPYRH
jgi:hypothetical protein